MFDNYEPPDPAGVARLIGWIPRAILGCLWLVTYPPFGLGIAIRSATGRTGPNDRGIGRWLLLVGVTLLLDLTMLAGGVNGDGGESIGRFFVIPAVQCGLFLWGLAGQPRGRGAGR
jgi:hypothetical protein